MFNMFNYVQKLTGCGMRSEDSHACIFPPVGVRGLGVADEQAAGTNVE